MGHILHHAIIVTGWDIGYFNVACDKAKELGMSVISQDGVGVNGFKTFLVCPDGSKEGWAESDLGDSQRMEFRKWLHTNKASLGLEWAEMLYGDDNGGASIVESAWTMEGERDE